MERITEKQLQAIVDRINRITKSPETAWTKVSDGKITANIGNYHLSHAYGGVCLHRIMSDGGGVHDIFRCGHIPKRDLANRMWAYLAGLESNC
jgi:hypothetical protein